jgi:hypothetical protein
MYFEDVEPFALLEIGFIVVENQGSFGGVKVISPK